MKIFTLIISTWLFALTALAASPLIPPKARFLDANGNPLAGGLVYTYAAGTTTPLATYTDAAEGTPNANPVVLDANGEANIWIDDAAYKIVLKNSVDVTQWTVDNVNQTIPTAQLRDLSVTTAKLAADAVTTAKILDANVTAAKLASDSVTTAKILDANVTTAKIADAAITQAKRAALGYQLSSSSGAFSSTTSGSWVDVTNLSVSITTTGRPVFVGIVSDGTSANSSITFDQTTPSFIGWVGIVRDSTLISDVLTSSSVGGGSSITLRAIALPWTIDTPAAGTYTYKIQGRMNNNTGTETFSFTQLKLIAFEL